MDYLVLKWLHVLSSTLLFGTGIGSAFYLLRVTLEHDPRIVAAVSRHVVVADWLFTSTTAVLQPATGAWMIYVAGYPPTARWLMWSYGLYALAIACWLPVVRIQIALRNTAQAAALANQPLPPRYWMLFRIWFALGIPAFLSFLAIFYLMVAKPS